MKYYHIRLDYFDKKIGENQTLYEYDFTDIQAIKKKIVAPYIRNSSFVFKGVKLNGADVRVINVFTSEYSISDCLTIAYRRLPKNVIVTYSKEGILPFSNLVFDITSDVVLAEDETDKGRDAQEEMTESLSSNKVFIVHGHDSEARLEVESFVRMLNLDPIVLFKEEDEGDTIIEKFERNSEVRYAVILYTYCDDGKDKNEDALRHRARQNVVFEHGFFVSKLGRKNVCALVKGDIELPGDYRGVVYKVMDNAGAWKLSLAKELKKAGLVIDLNDLL